MWGNGFVAGMAVRAMGSGVHVVVTTTVTATLVFLFLAVNVAVSRLITCYVDITIWAVLVLACGSGEQLLSTQWSAAPGATVPPNALPELRVFGCSDAVEAWRRSFEVVPRNCRCL